MKRLTTREKHPHGAEGRSVDNLTGKFCRGVFEATAVIEKLAYYENMEEDGKMLILPCKPGDEVYVICKNHVIKCIVYGINMDYKSIWFTFLHEGYIFKSKNIYFLDDFGKTVFLTDQEAKEALGEMNK